MQVIVKGRNFHVPDPLKELATEKLRKAERLFDRIQIMEIEFSEEHNPRISDRFTVEVTLTTKAHVLRAHASGPEPAAAVDAVAAKLQTQVRRLKGKIIGRGRAKKAARTSAVEQAGNPGLGTNETVRLESAQVSGDAAGPRITRVKRFAVKPMTPEEAVLQMEMLGHDFYLFVNAESEQAGVVYRRNDGSFGLIEPS